RSSVMWSFFCRARTLIAPPSSATSWSATDRYATSVPLLGRWFRAHMLDPLPPGRNGSVAVSGNGVPSGADQAVPLGPCERDVGPGARGRDAFRRRRPQDHLHAGGVPRDPRRRDREGRDVVACREAVELGVQLGVVLRPEEDAA